MLGFRTAPFERLEGVAVRAGDVVATLVGFGIAALDQAFSGHSRRADKQALGAGEGFGAALSQRHWVAFFADFAGEAVEIVHDQVAHRALRVAVGRVAAGQKEDTAREINHVLRIGRVARALAAEQIADDRRVLQQRVELLRFPLVAGIQRRHEHHDRRRGVVHAVAEEVDRCLGDANLRGFHDPDVGDAAGCAHGVHDFAQDGVARRAPAAPLARLLAG